MLLALPFEGQGSDKSTALALRLSILTISAVLVAAITSFKWPVLKNIAITLVWCGIGFIIFEAVAYYTSYTYRIIIVGIFAVALLISFMADILFLSLNRILVRISSHSNSFTLIFSLAALSLLLAALLILTPLSYCATHVKSKNGPFYLSLGICLFNFFDAVVASILYFYATLMFLHWLIWPLICKPIYALQRFKIFEHRVILGFTGLALFAFAFPGVGEPLLKLVEKIHLG